MSFPRIIPCLDMAHGRVVKGVSFEGLRDVGDPVELAQHYSKGGADELVLLDVAATPNEANTMLDVVRAVADALTIPFTVGGGVRSVDDATAIIEAGADRVSINSAALARPQLIGEIAERYGSQAVVVAIDAGDGVVHTHGGQRATGVETVRWAVQAAECGAGEILLTSMDQDGTKAGYDLPLTQSVSQSVQIPVIASGGAGTCEHIAQALEICEAALLASLLHYRELSIAQIKSFCQAQSLPIRL